MIRWIQRMTRPSLLERLGLICLLWAGLALGACSPTGETTLPPATAMAPSPPTATAPAPPTATPERPAPPTATSAPTQTEAAPQAKPRQAVSLTILHTNDVLGETYPCG